MSAIPAPDEHDPFGKIIEALNAEDFELLAETTRDYLNRHSSRTGAGAEFHYPFVKYLNLFANGYRRWQISYNYAEIRNYFYAARWHLAKAFPDKVPHLAQAFYALTEMLNAYTRCENSFINDDPLSLMHYSQKAQVAERKGLEILDRFDRGDDTVQAVREWLQKYLEKNLHLHTGLEACAQIYSRIFKQEPYSQRDFEEQVSIATKSLAALSDANSDAHSVELASELNAHIRFARLHYERTNKPPTPHGLTFLRLERGTVTLCLSAGCDSNTARDIVAKSGRFKERIKERFDSCGLDMTNFRAAPLHDIFQTSFGSHFLQMLTFNLPSITVKISDFLDRSYNFAVQVKLTSLGSCTVYLSHEVEDPGLTVEEVRALQSLICPHAGQVKIEFDLSPAGSRNVPLSSYKFSERFEFAVLDDLDALGKWIHQSGIAEGTFSQGLKTARGELEKEIDKLGKHASFATQHPTDADSESETASQPLFGQMNNLCKLIHSDYALEHRDTLKDRCNRLTYVTDFADWILQNVGRAFRDCSGVHKAEDPYERDRRWLISRDTGWYSYVHVRSLHQMDSRGKHDAAVESFEAVKEQPDLTGFLIEPREARASFDDWRFMSFRWRNYPNLASIRSHPCDAFFVSENRAFLFFPDDPKFLADQYEVTVELMMWLGTALKFCEGLSQRLVQDVSVCLNTDGSKLDEGDVKKHLDWISRLRVQAGAVQALVSKTGLSRYADHGELMTRMVENMKFLRIVELLDRRLSQFDQFYKKVDDETTYDAEDSARLSDAFLVLIGAVLTLHEVENWYWRIGILAVICGMGLLRVSKRLRRPVFKFFRADRW